MLEKVNNKKNVNIFFSVLKYDIIKTKNLQIVTRQGTKIGLDNPQISKVRSKEDYPNPIEQKQLYIMHGKCFKIWHQKKTMTDIDKNLLMN